MATTDLNSARFDDARHTVQTIATGARVLGIPRIMGFNDAGIEAASWYNHLAELRRRAVWVER